MPLLAWLNLVMGGMVLLAISSADGGADHAAD